MATKDFNLEPVQKNSALPDLDDAEETLSLCDLPLNGKDTDYSNDTSSEHQRASSSFDQDFFEFFGEDFTASGNYPTDNIIFCGKLIPYKGATVEEEEAQNQGEREDDATKPRNAHKKSRIFPWKSYSFNKSRTALSIQQGIKSFKPMPVQGSADVGRGTSKRADRCEFSTKKASNLSSPMKSSRLYMLGFGVGKFPTMMGLNDIKMRQSKRNQAQTTPVKMFVLDDTQSSDNEMAKSGSGYRAKSLWGLLKVLACSSYPADTAVKASFGCQKI